jgi:hypothetical protein
MLEPAGTSAASPIKCNRREKGEEEKRRGEKRGKELRMSLCLLRH